VPQKGYECLSPSVNPHALLPKCQHLAVAQKTVCRDFAQLRLADGQ
jgi:hypothetical protein